MQLIKKLSVFLLLIFPVAVFATEVLPNVNSKAYIVSAFKYYKNISPNIKNPSSLFLIWLKHN